MQLPHQTRLPVLKQLRPERAFLRALSQSQQSYQNVLLWIFVAQERLPPSVSYIVSSYQLDFIRSDLWNSF